MYLNINLKLNIKRVIFLIGDIFCLFFALFLTLLIRFGSSFSKEVFITHIYAFLILFIIWIIMIFSLRFYETHKPIKNRYVLITNIIGFSIVNFFISVLYFYINPQKLITPKTILLLDILIFAILFLIWRIVSNKFLYRYKSQENCLVISNNPDLIKNIHSKPEFELNIKAYINPDNNINHDTIEKTDMSNLENILKNNQIKSIVIDDNLLFDENISEKLMKCIDLKIEVIKTTEFYEQFLGKVVLKNINHVWFISNLNENKKFVFDFIKDIFDKIFAVIFFVISIIFIPFIIIGIKIESRGPIFFTQMRSGKNGKIFKVIKFRTMKIDAEKNGPQWASSNDPRTTKFGKFLRKVRLDEIPQFINIIRGDMSLIGPRPERPEFIEKLEKEIPHYNQRLLVKPGLSGWAQINYPYGASVEDAIEKLEYDLYYIKNRSFALDISIILKTINSVIRGSGL